MKTKFAYSILFLGFLLNSTFLANYAISKDLPINENVRIHSNFSEGLAIFTPKDSERQGFVNTKGNIVIPPVFTWVWYFQSGIAAACIEGNQMYPDMCGAINHQGQWVMKPKRMSEVGYVTLFCAKDVCTAISGKDTNIKEGLVNLQRKILIPINLSSKRQIGLSFDGQVVFYKNGAFNRRLNRWIVKPGEYNTIFPTMHSRYRAGEPSIGACKNKHENCVYLDEQGNNHSGKEYLHIGNFNNTNAVIYENEDKQILVDRNLNTVYTQDSFNSKWRISEKSSYGLVILQNSSNPSGPTMVVDYTGKIVLEPQREIIYSNIGRGFIQYSRVIEPQGQTVGSGFIFINKR